MTGSPQVPDPLSALDDIDIDNLSPTSDNHLLVWWIRMVSVVGK